MVVDVSSSAADQQVGNRVMQLAPGLIAATLPCLLSCLASVLWSTGSTDRAAQGLRVAVFEQVGFSPWSNQWFAGHHLAGYGLFVQALSSWFGSTLVAVAAAVLGSAGFWMIVRKVVERQSAAGSPLVAVVWCSLAMSTSVWAGRTPFCVGFAAATWAVLAALSNRRVTAAALAVAAGLASPVCAVFVCVAAVGWMGRERAFARTGAALAAGAAVVLAAGALLFPERGRYPFPVGSYLNIVASTVVLIVSVRVHPRVVRAGLAYSALATILFIVPNPVGSIVERLGSIVAGPILVLLWRPHLPRLPRLGILVAITVAVTAWQVRPMSFAWSERHPSYEAAFFEPAVTFLLDQPGVFRVEAVPLRSHAESDYLARVLPLARGWAGHVDRDRNPLFFGDLSADEYEAWLIEEGVSFVALANAPIDTTGLREAALVRGGLPFLEEVWLSPDWVIYAVTPRPTLATPGLEVTAMTVDTIEAQVEKPGAFELKVRFSPWFVVDGAACVSESESGWTTVVATRAGAITIRADWTWKAILDRNGTC